MATIKTNFQKVQEFNRAFDMVPQIPSMYSEADEYLYQRPEMFKDEKNIIKLRLDLIKEEVRELNDAIAANDDIEIRDALSDILYVVYGMADVLGVNIDKIFRNMIMSYKNKITNNYLNKLIK